jgi:hypothetical protein
MPAVDSESVLRFIRGKGPVIPVQIAKEIGQNIMMAGAVLSEMTSSGKLKVSKIKIGGSPLYYVPGQESRLMGFSQYLGGKERVTYDLLRQSGVLRDFELDALTRVTLREIKDFAVPLNVTIDGQTEVFWKWYLLSDGDGEKKIKSSLGFDESPSVNVPGEVKDNSSQAVLSAASIGSSVLPPVINTNSPLNVSIPLQQSFPIQSPPFSAPSSHQLASVKSASVPQSTLNQSIKAPHPMMGSPATGSEYEDDSSPKPSIKDFSKDGDHIEVIEENVGSKPLIEVGPQLRRRPVKAAQSSLDQIPLKFEQSNVSASVSLPHPVAPAQIQSALDPLAQFSEDLFFKKVQAQLQSRTVSIISASCNKRGSDYDMIISMLSPLGSMTMHCKALNKKKINEGDLSAAFIQAQFKHLPGVLVTPGELTKRAQFFLESQLKGLAVTKIDLA